MDVKVNVDGGGDGDGDEDQMTIVLKYIKTENKFW